jgi:hypothetical protein
VAPYTYQWIGTNNTSTYVTSVGPGTYTCVVTDGLGCTDTVVTVLAVSNIAATASASNPLCYGTNTGSVTVSATGGGGGASTSSGGQAAGGNGGSGSGADWVATGGNGDEGLYGSCGPIIEVGGGGGSFFGGKTGRYFDGDTQNGNLYGGGGNGYFGVGAIGIVVFEY